MSEHTYLEQYIVRTHILPRSAPDWLMESLKKVKDPKNERRIKNLHKFIEYTEKTSGKLALYQKAYLEMAVVQDSKLLREEDE